MIKNASIATLAMFLSAASPAMATNVAHSLYVNLELALNQSVPSYEVLVNKLGMNFLMMRLY